MNIRDHIEAGHYPRDDKGRALVREQSGRTAHICATDAPGSHCIMGFDELAQRSWTPDGEVSGYENSRLLPPPPRKVKVTGYARVIAGTRCFVNVYEKRLEAAQDLGPRETLVELTGEYEEPWS